MHTLFKKYTVYFILTLGIVLSSALGSTYASTSIIVYDEKSTYQQTFYEQLENKTNLAGINLVAISSSNLNRQKIKELAPLAVINTDKSLTQQLIDLKLQVPLIHTLLTKADSKQFLSCLPACEIKSRKNNFLVLDQPPKRQLALIKLIKPSARNIGVIYSDQTADQIKALELAANQFSFTIKQFLTTPKTLGFNVNNMAKSSDVQLALADTVIFNPSTLPQILLTSYRYHIPVIGFSKGFIKAGALAGVISNLNHLADQVSEALSDIASGHAIISNGIIYPKYFNVISNRRVANSLNLHFPSDRTLTETLKSNESP